MSISLPVSVTGATVPGFTAPTYSPIGDTAPVINAKQFAFGTVGGTQVGVDVNTVSKPFTVTFIRPAVLRTLPGVNPTTGVIKNIPYNTYKVITRKGVVPAVNQPPMVARATTTFEIPAGAETYESEDVKALVSSHIGVLNSQSSGLADTISSGIL